ncbi:hypothetical protein [Duganella callida]|uniref:Uncharacterized protein n=1 Tax=Duganella callida TaxID=2561932 RepID=A0A4Y9SBI8_9BURK|nr:hypothetical protein [Duganella callida]TFW19658.1 hypothetical protein E4L98_15935 [Duganella callida]
MGDAIFLPDRSASQKPRQHKAYFEARIFRHDARDANPNLIERAQRDATVRTSRADKQTYVS